MFNFKALALSALLSSAALAIDLNERVPASSFTLGKRQQFIPTTSTAQGADCVAAFGEGYLTCREKTDTRNRLCYNPTLGDTCCESTWACPESSFCLVDPYCCPNGMDPKTCAEQRGITLSSSFTPVSTKAAASEPAPSVPAPYPTGAKNATIPTPTASGYPGFTKPAEFTGAANVLNGGYVAAAAGGILGLIGLL